MPSLRFSNFYRRAAIAAVAISTSVAGQVFAERTVLTDKAAMTVYTFDKDTSGKSVCYGDCAAAWPPVATGNMPAANDIGVIVRDDGSKQAAYKGKPLYLFAGDRKPGDMAGDNIQNVWHVVPLSGNATRSTLRDRTYSGGSSY